MKERFAEIRELESKYHFYYRYYMDTREECFCFSENDYTQNPQHLHKGVPTENAYPIGTFLSLCLRVLDDIFTGLELEESDDISEDQQIELIDQAFNLYFPESEEINEERETLSLFLYLQLIKMLVSKTDDIPKAKAKNCMSFIEMCSLDRAYCNLEFLDRFVSMNQDTIPMGRRMPFDFHISGYDYKYNLADMLETIAEYHQKQAQFETITQNIGINAKSTSLNRTFIYYKVNSVYEFMLIALQVLFSNKRIIKICEQCGKYFVPMKRADEKYCSLTSSDNGKTCKEQAKLEKQLKRERTSESSIIHKRIRTKLFNRIGSSVEEYENREKTYNCFMKLSRQIRGMIRNGHESMEMDYIKWMEEFDNNKFDIDKDGYNEDVKKIIIKKWMNRVSAGKENR